MPSWRNLIANNAAPFLPRDTGYGFKFNERLFLSNGYPYGGGNIRDLWCSADEGETWYSVNVATPYEPYAAIATLGNDMFAVGTRTWKSSNGGASWVDFAAGPQSTLDVDAKIVKIGDAFYLVSGIYGVQRSMNLVDWTPLSTPPWPSRWASGLAVFNERIYVMSGRINNVPNVPPELGAYPNASTISDCWSMGEDTCWRQEAPLPWTGRFWPALVEGGGHLWMMGGYRNLSNPPINYSELWRMDASGRWTNYDVPNGPGPRHAPTLWFSNGKLIVACGNNNPQGRTQNDVWSLTL